MGAVAIGQPGDLPLGLVASMPGPIALDAGGDHRNDAAAYDTSAEQWLIQQSTNEFYTQNAMSFGLPSDVRRIADLDGDGRGDLVAFRPSTGVWYASLSATGYSTYQDYGQWGQAGDAVVPQWLLRTSTSDFAASQVITWGMNGDVAVPADYDGDGRLDIAVFRPSTGRWYVKRSSDDQTITIDWGLSSDTAVPADYDGDGRADIAVFRPSTGEWWIKYSSSDYATFATIVYGVSGDVPIPGDYDGDGRAEPAIFRVGEGIHAQGRGRVLVGGAAMQAVTER